MVDHSTDIHLVNMTIKTTAKGQAEGLLLNGERNIISHVTIVGSGDALQTNGSAYYTHSRIVGDGDMILGRGPAFFNDCILHSYSVYMWIRNTEANHGNVFLNCTFQTLGNGKTELARAPVNGGKSYPFCEAVLINCALDGISPVGWGKVGGETTNIHYWEYNSTNLSDGRPIDASQRHPVSRQLDMVTDSAIIANYSHPAYVLGGWKPAMAPIILSQPMSLTLKTGEKAIFNICVAAVPEATCQWYKNGKPIEGATETTLVLEKVHSEDTGFFTVTARNSTGQVTSQIVRLEVES
jgi:hypothetical protein